MDNLERRYAPLVAVLLCSALQGCATSTRPTPCAAQGCPSDAEITSQVQSRLGQEPALGPPNQVYVQTLDGVVYLTGLVGTPLQRGDASLIARHTPGVRRVVNNIGVTNR
jgi:osmotically-inducible protein OsmY